ncbi:MAG: prepilin peptidase [Steroidobacteraceae bacterium]
MTSRFDPILIVVIAAVLGLIIGSFLNTVIHRLPRMLERRWRLQCEELAAAPALGTPPDTAPPSSQGSRYDLVLPRSHCPACQTPVRARDLIPVLSWFVLRGRCAACGVAISPRYPTVEAFTAVLFALAAAQLGLGWSLLGVLLVTAMLIALAFIDLDTYFLPDEITLPLLWIGLAASVTIPLWKITPSEAVLGAIFGYLSLWIVYQAFKLATGREGMGYGDFKLLAALGAWAGPFALLPIILLASIAGAIVGITMMLAFGRGRYTPLAFGPYLAAAGWITLVYGDRVTPLLQTMVR